METYRECLRNHAASLGSYATDGCGEFTLDLAAADHPSAGGDQLDSSGGGGSLQCAACGCHRNFHRKVTYSAAAASRDLIELNVPAGDEGDRSNMMSAAAMMRSSSNKFSGGGGGGSKRFRTKFTAEQKEKMLVFAEKIGWRLQRKDLEEEIEKFCRGVGVTRQVFKVWMHNHKNATTSISSASTNTGNASSLTQ